MSAFLHDVADASLPLAIVLLVCAAAARAALWAQVDVLAARNVAWQYLEPLSTWCLAALALHTLALGAAGDLGALSLALPLGLGAAAVLLRSAPQERRPAEPQVQSSPAANRPAEPQVPSSPAANRPAEPQVPSSRAANRPAEPQVQSSPAANRPAEPRVQSARAASRPAEPETPSTAAPAVAGSLWAEPLEEQSARRVGLWSR